MSEGRLAAAERLLGLKVLECDALRAALGKCIPALQAAHYGVLGDTAANSEGVTKEQVSSMTFDALQLARQALAGQPDPQAPSPEDK